MADTKTQTPTTEERLAALEAEALERRVREADEALGISQERAEAFDKRYGQGEAKEEPVPIPSPSTVAEATSASATAREVPEAVRVEMVGRAINSKSLFAKGYEEAGRRFYTEKTVAEALKGVKKGSKVTAVVDSFGGDVSIAQAVESAFSPYDVTVEVTNLATSLGAYFALRLAKDKEHRKIAPMGEFMIHEPRMIGLMSCTADEFFAKGRKTDAKAAAMAMLQSGPLGKTPQEVRDLQKANGGDGTTWSGAETIEEGFFTQLGGDPTVSAVSAEQLTEEDAIALLISEDEAKEDS